MRITVTILDSDKQEVARIVFPNKETFLSTWMLTQLPYTYEVEWEEDEFTAESDPNQGMTFSIPSDYAESAE